MARYQILKHPPRVVGAAALLMLSTAGCEPPGGSGAMAGGAPSRPAASELVSASTGLSHLPLPERPAALAASLRRHYPAALRESGRGASVLVDVRVDETGRVLDVGVVDNRDKVRNGGARMVLLDQVPGSNLRVEREAQVTYDPVRFGAAARAAVREVRFRPALRDGKAVPYTLRMTVTFTPPSAR